MNRDYPNPEVEASPEYILAVIRDDYRQQSQFNPEVDKGIELSFRSTIKEWRNAHGLGRWHSLGMSLNEYFKTDFSEEQWKKALEPAHEKTLQKVCDLLATKAKRVEIKPFGNGCVEAGIFLTMRSMIINAGIGKKIKPSTLIGDFSKNNFPLFLKEISRLEPGALPDVKIVHPLYNGAILGWAIGMVIACFGAFGGPVLVIFGVMLAAASYAAIWAVAGKPEAVEFGSLKTFRDLALAIASARQKRLSGECQW